MESLKHKPKSNQAGKDDIDVRAIERRADIACREQRHHGNDGCHATPSLKRRKEYGADQNAEPNRDDADDPKRCASRRRDRAENGCQWFGDRGRKLEGRAVASCHCLPPGRVCPRVWTGAVCSREFEQYKKTCCHRTDHDPCGWS